MESGFFQETQEARHMAVIVPEVEFPGLFVRVGFCRKCLVFVVVMTEVLRGFVLIVLAIVSYRSPGDLEREQTQHEEHKKSSHGQHCNDYGLTLSMMKWAGDYPKWN